MSKKNSNQKKYIISWDDGEYSDIMDSLKECESLIAEVVEDSSCDVNDILVYEISASYAVKSKAIELTKRNAGII